MLDKAFALGERVEHFGGGVVDRTATNLVAVTDGYGHADRVFFLIN